jgi:enoyl-[acyl-carrier-protein] reductase (NADH)
MFGEGSKIYAMTSEGSSRVIASYGAVSAAKAALESHCRQLAMELARLGSGVTVNAIRAGVTMTPALMQIPERDKLIEHAESKNPMGRMTTVHDVAQAVVRLSESGTHWLTGNVLGVDGGELIAG